MSGKAKVDAAVAAILAQHAPFYTARLNFKSAAGTYGCVFGDGDVNVGATEAVTYRLNRYGAWAHITCVKRAQGAVIDDATQKATAKADAAKAARAAQKASKASKATTKSKAPDAVPTTTSPDVDAVLTQAMALVDRQDKEIIRLRAENARILGELQALRSLHAKSGALVTATK